MQSSFKRLKGLFIISSSLFNVIPSYATDDIVERSDIKQRTQVCQSNQHNFQLKDDSPFNLIPNELKLTIFSYLTLEELNILAQTNKDWFDFITDNYFLSSIFNKTLKRIREEVNDEPSTSQDESFIGYIQEYWDSLDNWLSLVAQNKSLADKKLPWSFVQAFVSFSQVSPTILNSLSTIRINHYGNIENDLKKIFILGIHEKEFLFDSFPPKDRQHFIECCYTDPQDFILRIKAFQNHRLLLVPAHIEEDDQTRIRESCLRLSAEKINILAKYASFELLEIRANHHGENEIIEACLKLTPQQMEERLKAIHKHAESVFTNNEDIYERSSIIACLLKLDEQQIDAITKYLPFLSHYEKGVDRYSTPHGTRIKTIQAYSTLTSGQMHAVGRHVSLLFTAKMKIEEKRAVIKTCTKLTPEQIMTRLNCLQEFKTVLFSSELYEQDKVITAALELTPEQITTIGNYAPLIFIPETRLAQRNSFMRACLKLTPEEITSKLGNIKKYAPFILDFKRRPYGDDALINGFLDLTLEQVKALEPHAAYLFGLSGISDSVKEIMKIFKSLTPEEIMLRTEYLKKHAASLTLKHNSTKQKNALIIAYLELPHKHIEALATRANWLIKWNLDTIKNEDAVVIIKACQNLTSEDLILRSEYLEKHSDSLFPKQIRVAQYAEMIAIYLALSPENNEALRAHTPRIFTPDMATKERGIIIKACQNLTSRDITMRLQSLQKHRASFLDGNLTGDQKSNIIATCLKLEPEQINALGNHIPDLLSKVDQKGVNAIIATCQNLTPQQIEIFGKYLFSCLKKDKRGDEYGKVIEACKHMILEEIQIKLQILQKYSSSLIGQRDQSKVIISCLGLASDQIEAVGMSISRFFTQDMMGEDREYILQSCASLSPEEIISRSSAIQQYVNLLYPSTSIREVNEDSYNDEEVIVASEFIAKSLQIPAKDLTLHAQEIQKHYSSIFPEEFHPYDTNVLHTTLIQRTTDQISTIAAYASILFKEDMDGERRSEIIHAFTTVEPQEIAEKIFNIKEYFYPLLPKNINVSFYSGIVENCLKLPLSQMALQAQKIKEILITFNKRMHRHKHSRIVSFLLELTSEQISTLSKYVSSLWRKGITPMDLEDIIQECRKLTPEQISDHLECVATKHVKGQPDLVVEILSFISTLFSD